MKSARRRALGADYTRVGGRLGGRRIAASRARVPVGGGAGAPGGVRTTGAIRRAFGGGGRFPGLPPPPAPMLERGLFLRRPLFRQAEVFDEWSW